MTFLARFVEAERFVEIQAYPEAIALLRKIQADFPRAYLPHFRLGECCRAQKRYEEAADHYDHALALNPRTMELEILKSMSFVLMKLGQFERVRPHLARLIELSDDPKDLTAARGLMNWALLGPDPLLQAMVRFDRNAARYDEGMASNPLQPAVPIVERINAWHGHAFIRGVDLGAGTGKGGEALRGRCVHLTAVDASTGMLQVARSKRVYQRLEGSGALEYLSAQPDASHDLVYAAATITYFRALDALFAQVRRVLLPGGLFAFDLADTTEVPQYEEKPGLMSLQHVHNPDYVLATAAAAGLALVERSTHQFRYVNDIEDASVYLLTPAAAA